MKKIYYARTSSSFPFFGFFLEFFHAFRVWFDEHSIRSPFYFTPSIALIFFIACWGKFPEKRALQLLVPPQNLVDRKEVNVTVHTRNFY